MTRIFIINDCHLGVRRQSGTTHASREALSDWMHEQFSKLLSLADGHDLIVLGDLFDSHQVSRKDEIKTYRLLSSWQQRNPTHRLVLLAGNHDLSRNSQDISSFENLCAYLEEGAHPTTRVIGRTEFLSDDLEKPWMALVSHMPNQELFDAEIEKLHAVETLEYVLLHCNLDNHFAKESDHSLNLSQEQLNRFVERNVKVIFAHEHNARTLGNATVIGNQIPSSISDCKDCSHKGYLTLDDSGLHWHEFLAIPDIYAEVDWCSEDVPDRQFIRVSGTAAYEEAATVVQKLSDIRRQSNAFVIANAVKVGELETTFDSTEELKTFDVQQMILDELPETLAARFKEVVNYAEH